MSLATLLCLLLGCRVVHICLEEPRRVSSGTIGTPYPVSEDTADEPNSQSSGGQAMPQQLRCLQSKRPGHYSQHRRQVAQSVTLALGLRRHVWASAGSSVQTHTVIFEVMGLGLSGKSTSVSKGGCLPCSHLCLTELNKLTNEI